MALALAGCGGDGMTTPTPDANVVDDNPAADVVTTPDVTTVPDAADVAQTQDTPAVDAAPDAPADASPDASMDAVSMDAVSMDALADAPAETAVDVAPIDTGCAGDDACPAAQHCDPMTRACVSGCHSDDGCVTATTDGGAAAMRCDTAAHACVACVTNDHCPLGNVCMDRNCVPGCTDAHGCPSGATCCTGACVDTTTTLSHCGACGAVCAVANGTPVCRAGGCAVSSCATGFGDCDTMATTGCEVDTTTALAHCGGCGMACETRANTTSTCAAGACGYACTTGFGDCDAMTSTGCETDTRVSLTHCGACGRACAPAFATGACAAGACTIASCNAGRGDCDAMATNGCEVDTQTSTANCGRCGAACVTGQSCTAGVCRTLRSCNEIHTALPTLPSGAYTIDPDGAAGRAAFTVYCDMTHDGGGWTLALKVNGANTTFLYDAAYWGNDATLNPTSTNLDAVEAKFDSFSYVPFTTARLEFVEGTTTRGLVVPFHSQTSLRGLFVSDTFDATSVGRAGWSTLVSSPSLQRNCNREGFNNNVPGFTRVRFGIVGNQEDDCNSPDSRIGIGGQGNACVAAQANTAAGNVAACTAENGDRNTPVFAYLYVR